MTGASAATRTGVLAPGGEGPRGGGEREGKEEVLWRRLSPPRCSARAAAAVLGLKPKRKKPPQNIH